MVKKGRKTGKKHQKRKEERGKSVMRKSILFGLMLAMGVVLPGVSYVTSESKCDIDTLGAESGDVELDAVWAPKTVQCDPGEYFKESVVDCVDCESGNWCPGGEYTYNGVDQGMYPCGDGWTSDARASAQEQCYQPGEKTCAEQNPYEYGHGHAIYDTEQTSVQCKVYKGDTTTCIVEPGVETPVCTYSHLECDEGYTEISDGGVLKCVAGIECVPGKYLPAGQTSCEYCPENYYCEGGTFNFADVDQGITACPEDANKWSPAKSRKPDDCGYLLHVGDDILHLHKDNTKTPENHVMAVKVGEDVYYADTTPITEGEPKKTIRPGSTEVLIIKIDGQDYAVHERTYDD